VTADNVRLDRGPAGKLGTGMPGRSLKRTCPSGASLRAFARDVARDAKHGRHADAIAWLKSKHITFRSGASAPR
jgi:hypothetical protein